MRKRDFTPIVCGGDILGYSYAREIYKHYGKKTVVLTGAKVNYTRTSRFVNYMRVPDVDRPEVMMRYLRERSGSYGDSVPIVFGGTGDWRIRTLSEHREELQKLGYIIPTIGFPLLDQISQKDIFYEACFRAGVPFPKTWVYGFRGYSCEACGDRIIPLSDINEVKDLAYPLIAKPSNSANWHFAEVKDQHKIYKIHSAEEMAEVIQNVENSSYRYALLLQECLSESDESLHTITTFSDAEGNILVGVTGNVILQSHTALGIGNPLVILGKRDEALLEQAGRLLKEWKYEGYANFDAMEDANGVPHFLEINTRPGRNTYYFSLAGCSFVKPFIEHYVYENDLQQTLSAEELEANQPFVFSTVSEELVDYFSHGTNHEEAMACIRDGKMGNPILCEEDRMIQQFFAKRYVRAVSREEGAI